MAIIKKTGMRRKKETFYTLIGVQSSEANMKTTVEVTQPPKSRYRQSTVYQNIRHNPNTCVSMTATAHVTTAKIPNQDRGLTVDEQIKKRCATEWRTIQSWKRMKLGYCREMEIPGDHRVKQNELDSENYDVSPLIHTVWISSRKRTVSIKVSSRRREG